MNKYLLLVIAAVFHFTAPAQVTISNADGPQQGLTIITYADTLNATGPQSNGPAKTWNFSTLAGHLKDTVVFGQVAGTPAAAAFSNSHFCIVDSSTGAYTYISNTSSAFQFDGYYVVDPTLGPMTVVADPPSVIIKYPAAYMSSYTNTSNVSIKFPFNTPPFDSLWSRQSTQQNSSINAWGTLTTPSGVYNCIRQDIMDVTKDSLFAYMSGAWYFMQETIDTSKASRWWTNGKGFPVLDMSLDPQTNAVITTGFLMSAVVGIEEAQPHGPFVLCYPNPAEDELNFSAPAGGNITVTDLSGKSYACIAIDGCVTTVQTATWPAGVYFYTLISGEGEKLSGKVIVHK